MRNKKLFFFLTLLIGLSSIIFTKTSCKKVEQTNLLEQAPTESLLLKEFFKNSENVNSTTKRVVDKMKEAQSIDKSFIAEVVKKFGYPVWDKSMLRYKNTSASKSAEESSDTSVVIPIVQPTDTDVQSCLEAIVNQNVSIEFFERNKYPNYPFGNDTLRKNKAERYVVEFMKLSKSVFNHNSFRILDKRLFYDSATYNEPVNRSTYIKLQQNTQTGKTQNAPLICTVTVTYDVVHNCSCVDPNNCDDCVDGLSPCWTSTENINIDCGNGGGPGPDGPLFVGNGYSPSGYVGGGSSPNSNLNPVCNCPYVAPYPWIVEEDDYPNFTDGGNPTDAIFKLQASIIRNWKGSPIANGTAKEKGNFGEIASDVVLYMKDYIPMHKRIIDIELSGHHGVDGLFKKGNTYYIVEAKFGVQTLSSGPPQQMSTDWLNGQQPTNNPGGWTRIQYAAGGIAKGNEVMASNPVRLVAYVDANGIVVYKILTVGSNGNVTPGAVFNP